MAHHIILDHSQWKLPEVAPQDAQINYVYHNSVQGKENRKFLFVPLGLFFFFDGVNSMLCDICYGIF